MLMMMSYLWVELNLVLLGCSRGLRMGKYHWALGIMDDICEPNVTRRNHLVIILIITKNMMRNLRISSLMLFVVLCGVVSGSCLL